MVFAFLSIIFFVAIACALPIGISLIANYSRQSRRKKLIASLSAQPRYSASIRINSDKVNQKVIKFKAFEYSGILYIIDNKICIKGSNGQYKEFDINAISITWVGIQLQNGALQWFCITNEKGEKTYVNADTGAFVFRLSKKQASTQDIFKHLLIEQSMNKIG